jgi:hypothetical protein
MIGLSGGVPWRTREEFWGRPADACTSSAHDPAAAAAATAAANPGASADVDGRGINGRDVISTSREGET